MKENENYSEMKRGEKKLSGKKKFAIVSAIAAAVALLAFGIFGMHQAFFVNSNTADAETELIQSPESSSPAPEKAVPLPETLPPQEDESKAEPIAANREQIFNWDFSSIEGTWRSADGLRRITISGHAISSPSWGSRQIQSVYPGSYGAIDMSLSNHAEPYGVHVYPKGSFIHWWNRETYESESLDSDSSQDRLFVEIWQEADEDHPAVVLQVFYRI